MSSHRSASVALAVALSLAVSVPVTVGVSGAGGAASAVTRTTKPTTTRTKPRTTRTTKRPVIRRTARPTTTSAGITGVVPVAVASPAEPAASAVAAIPVVPVTTVAPLLAVSATFVPDPIVWTACAAYECAKVRVPRDYDLTDLSAGLVTLQVIRNRTTSADRIGALFVYPGGPGGSSVTLVQSIARRVSPENARRFDIVGIDTRGLPRSTPFRCGNTNDLSSNREARARYTASCKANAPEEIATTDSETNARDMDMVRAAMGDPSISFLGYSYGGQLGRAYSVLFPERVRAMILDSPTDPGTDPQQRIIDQFEARESTLASFLQYCAARPACAFNDGSDLLIRYNALAAQIASVPIAGPTYTLDRGLLELLVDDQLRSDGQWPALGSMLRDLFNTGSLTRVTSLVSTRNLGSSDANARDNALAVYLSTVCHDGFMPSTQAQLDELALRIPVVAPHFVTRVDNHTAGGTCVNWPVAARVPRPAPLSPTGPTLIISTVWDLTTPHEWGQQLAQAIGAFIIPVDRTGHGVFPGLSCVDTLATRFLVDLTPPALGTRCA